MTLIIELPPDLAARLLALPEAERQAFAVAALRNAAERRDGAATEAVARGAAWKRWDRAGAAATDEARAHLHARGIGLVYEDERGVIVEELPDGTVQPLNAAS
jgi:hypothetical protein